MTGDNSIIIKAPHSLVTPFWVCEARTLAVRKFVDVNVESLWEQRCDTSTCHNINKMYRWVLLEVFLDSHSCDCREQIVGDPVYSQPSGYAQ